MAGVPAGVDAPLHSGSTVLYVHTWTDVDRTSYCRCLQLDVSCFTVREVFLQAVKASPTLLTHFLINICLFFFTARNKKINKNNEHTHHQVS